jgi:hypothetical protein
MRLVIVALALVVTAPLSAVAEKTFVKTPLLMDEQVVSTDKAGVWTNEEVGGKAFIASTTYKAPDGRVVLISMLANIEGCMNQKKCAVRVLLLPRNGGGKRKELIKAESTFDYDGMGAQLCASPDFYEISTDLTTLKACDELVKLEH